MRDFLGKKGFTLAEVLITLGIIGVVAAMTLPTLITNVQKQTLAVATRKFHSKLSNAVQLYMAEQGTNDFGTTDMSDQHDNDNSWERAMEESGNFARNYFSVVKECDVNDVDKCFAEKYRNFSNSAKIFFASGFINQGGKAFVISDGTVFTFVPGSYDMPAAVTVDVNGPKGPNVIGYDLWNMSIFYDGSVDESGATPEARKEGKLQEKREGRFAACKAGWGYGGCFGHFLNNNYKFDY